MIATTIGSRVEIGKLIAPKPVFERRVLLHEARRLVAKHAARALQILVLPPRIRLAIMRLVSRLALSALERLFGTT